MKKTLFVLQFLFLLLFLVSLYLGVVELTNATVSFKGFDHAVPKYNGKELYDPALARLASINKLEQYCDSVYNEKAAANPSVEFEDTYPLVASLAVRKRFYHGYSSYSLNDNYMALMLEPFTGKWMSAIVIPDDIMKHPYAACSQQSIVMMELLKRKGYTTRKIVFTNGKEYGHFAFETFYKGNWHFSDPNLEPDRELLLSRENPSIEILANDKALLLAAYRHMPQEQVLNIFKKFDYGEPNTFPAPRGIIYQKTTKFLSYTAWLFFLAAFLFVRKRYLRRVSNLQYVRNKWVHFPGFKRKRSSSYYPATKASRA